MAVAEKVNKNPTKRIFKYIINGIADNLSDSQKLDIAYNVIKKSWRKNFNNKNLLESLNNSFCGTISYTIVDNKISLSLNSESLNDMNLID